MGLTINYGLRLGRTRATLRRGLKKERWPTTEGQRKLRPVPQAPCFPGCPVLPVFLSVVSCRVVGPMPHHPVTSLIVKQLLVLIIRLAIMVHLG